MKSTIIFFICLISASSYAKTLNCKLDAETMARYNDWRVVSELQLDKNPTAKVVLKERNNSAVVGDYYLGLDQGHAVIKVPTSVDSSHIIFSLPYHASSGVVKQFDLYIDKNANTYRLNVYVSYSFGQSEPVAVFECR